MIQEIHIKNYRSIVDATVKLSPFTLLIGANGTGKTNFLRLLKDVSRDGDIFVPIKHINHTNLPQSIKIIYYDQRRRELLIDSNDSLYERKKFLNEKAVLLFNVQPSLVAGVEPVVEKPFVKEDGSGTAQVLDWLKSGDAEERFDLIEAKFKQYIPTVEKLSLRPANGGKQIQVREKHIDKPILLAEMSEGTQLVLAILTIVYQPNPPKIICLEEIDRGLHPRLLQQIVQLLFRITEERDVQIIATTHNPYLVDQFKDHEECVVIVEKINGETQFTNLVDKMEELPPFEQPLGSLWYAGYLGGVPEKVGA